MPRKPRACNKSKKNVKSNKRVEHGVPLWSRVWFTFQVNGTEERFTGIVSQVRATHWRLVHFHDKSLYVVHLSPSTKGRSWDICDVVMKGRSSLHGKGLFAMSPIKGGQIVTSARFNSATPKEIEAMKSKITASGAIVPPLSTIHHRRSEVLYDPKLFRAARPEEHPNWYAMNDEAPKKANCRLACKKLAPQCLMLFWIAIRRIEAGEECTWSYDPAIPNPFGSNHKQKMPFHMVNKVRDTTDPYGSTRDQRAQLYKPKKK